MYDSTSKYSCDKKKDKYEAASELSDILDTSKILGCCKCNYSIVSFLILAYFIFVATVLATP